MHDYTAKQCLSAFLSIASGPRSACISHTWGWYAALNSPHYITTAMWTGRNPNFPDGTLRWRVEFPKSKKRWVAKKRYVAKSDAVLHDLMDAVYMTPNCRARQRFQPAFSYSQVYHTLSHEMLLLQSALHVMRSLQRTAPGWLNLQPVGLENVIWVWGIIIYQWIHSSYR